MQENAANRLREVRQTMAKAQVRFGSNGGEAELVAVSKMFPTEDIRPLLNAGQRVFGENRVQEAKAKWPTLRDDFDNVELHLIGPLQTNKVRDAIEIFDVIETLDREKLAIALAKEQTRIGKAMSYFVQVNIGGETQKAGIAPDQTVAFVQLCQNQLGLNVIGLMCIPPAGEVAGPYFAQLAGLAKAAGVDGLSMGMSADFGTAIEMGASHVRVGSALFGQRPAAQ